MTTKFLPILRCCASIASKFSNVHFSCGRSKRDNSAIIYVIKNVNIRYYSSEQQGKKSITIKNKDEVGTPKTFEKVKETTKTASYLGIILAGVGLTGFIFYTVFKELFSSKSPNTVYSSALERCINDPRISDKLGEPIKGFGEETRRGRRRHVSHLFYEKDGAQYLRMKFYIQGSRKKGTVHLEMKENDKKQFEYRYLFVQMDDFPREAIIIEDNRYDIPSTGIHM